ncbi:MAG: LLM class flavin-dependent oxidoreductase [Gammaproteobacteria bacterium]|nr:LLM class flavin-dependent oxidoreductase [Gammaproteobacteria bacterium]
MNDQPDSLQLGLFMPNCSNMSAISTYRAVPDEWDYESNKRIALAAEAAGFDFLFPVSRWRGFGGDTDYLGTSLETMTWASALLAVTTKIRVYSTVHVPAFHPLVVAKMGATLDHIGQGRWGVNLVSGWSKDEFGMMGIDLLPHAERYQRTKAFIEVLKGLWTQAPGCFNYDSPWYTIRGGYSLPQPVQQPHPPIVNAGISADAKAIIAEHCDWAFISMFSIASAHATVADIKTLGHARGRDVRCAGFPFVLWRDSADEAQAEIDKIIAHKDTVASSNWLNGLNLQSGSFDQFTLDMMTLGAGAFPLVGTAEDVAVKLKALHDVGLDGVLMVFQAYHRDTLRFQTEVMPLLREMGVIAR